jgi:hypothetical protein
VSRAWHHQALSRWARNCALRPPHAVLSLALLLLAVALRTWQYAGNGSLWLDEVELARNILQRPLGQLLTTPLLRDQVAPPGYLGLTKLVVMMLGDSELALRLVPYLASLLSIPLFWSVSRRVLDLPARTSARAMFALGFAFIWYGSEVKQYSSDITIALALTLLALDLPARLRRPGWPAVSLGAGILAGWFSNPALFVLAGVAGALLLESHRTGAPPLRRLLPLVATWAVASGLAVTYETRTISVATDAAMHRHWAFALLPTLPWHPVDLVWPLVRLGSVFGDSGLRYGWPALELGLAILGVAALLRSNRGIALVLLGPVVMALLAASLRLYPFSGRVVAFAMPTFVIALACGIEQAATEIGSRLRLPSTLGRVGLLIPVLGPVLLAPPVYRPEEIRPVLAYVARQRLASEPVYVYYGAGSAAQYYGPRLGLAGASVTIGSDAHRDDLRVPLRELDRFRGRPGLWVVFAHDPTPARDAILGYLGRIGTLRDSTVVPARLPLLSTHGASAYRVDLSDSIRLGATTADAFVLGGALSRSVGHPTLEVAPSRCCVRPGLAPIEGTHRLRDSPVHHTVIAPVDQKAAGQVRSRRVTGN